MTDPDKPPAARTNKTKSAIQKPKTKNDDEDVEMDLHDANDDVQMQEDADDVDVDMAANDDDEEEEEEENDDMEYTDPDAPGGSSSRKSRSQYLDSARKQKQGLATQSAKLASLQTSDAKKRYAYLIGQTDIFSHFIRMGDSDAQSTSTKKQGSTNNRRHRKTEKEEDEELLQSDTETGDLDHGYVFTESPSFVVGGVMRDYQIQGLNWLISLYKNGINGILADEMGLGKTLQTISFLGYLKHVEGVLGPHLVIVPKSTLWNWVKEFGKWVPTLKVKLFHGTKEERAVMVRDWLIPGDFEVCVTSYEMCLLEKTALKKLSWQSIVIDEAHRIKNENSSLSVIVRVLQCRNRLLITGTPLQNNLHELWALLNFLLPDVFHSSEDFDNWFKNDMGGDQDKVVSQLHKLLRPFLLRRIKADVEKSLLPKKRINLYVGMSSMQRKWYQKILEKDIDAVNGVVSNRKESKTRLQNIVMQLRKCCNHPYLFDGAEPGPPYTTDQHIVDNAGKMVLLDKLLQRLKMQGSRVLIFSQMSRVLDILEDYCLWRGYDYCRLDGQTGHEDRVASIDEFNREGSNKFLFLLTTRAGGLGINLATADTVVMYDNDWNPQVDLQAEDRAHRIGQKKQVVIFRFITENAIEEKVIDRATQKLRLNQLVIQQGRTAQPKAATKDDLVSMIQYGAENIFRGVDSTITSDDLDEVLKRSEKKTAELDEKYKNMGLDDLQKFTIEEGSSAYQWEGEDFRGKRGGIGLNWIGPSKRERRVNYDVDSYYKSNVSSGGRSAGPRAPKMKMVSLNEYQFFPARLGELQEKEKYAMYKASGYKPSRSDCAETEEEAIDRWIEEEEKKIENAVALTEAEIEEKEKLVSEGFEGWTRRDYVMFVKANEKHGRDNLAMIVREMEGKSAKEVERYWRVFWQRYKEISDWEKVVGNIERGEMRLKRTKEIQGILERKVGMYKLPLQQMRIVYGQNKGKNYTEEEDRFLVVMAARIGYGREDMGDRLREEIRRSSLFRFDWFLKSRTAAELVRRSNTLVGLVLREEERKK